MAHAVPRYLFRVIGPRRSVGARPLRTVRALVRVRAVADVPGVAQSMTRAGVRAGAVALPGFYDNADQEEELAHLRRGCPFWLSSLAVCHGHCASFVTRFDGVTWYRREHSAVKAAAAALPASVLHDASASPKSED